MGVSKHIVGFCSSKKRVDFLFVCLLFLACLLQTSRAQSSDMTEMTTVVNKEDPNLTQEKQLEKETNDEGAVDTETMQNCDFDKCIVEGKEVEPTLLMGEGVEDLDLTFDLVTPHEVVPFKGKDLDVYYWMVIESPIQSNPTWTSSKDTFPYYLKEMLVGGTSDKNSFLGKLGEGYNPHMMIIPYRQGQYAMVNAGESKRDAVFGRAGVDRVHGGTRVQDNQCDKKQIDAGDAHIANFHLFSLKNSGSRETLRRAVCSILPYAEFVPSSDQVKNHPSTSNPDWLKSRYRDRWPAQEKLCGRWKPCRDDQLRDDKDRVWYPLDSMCYGTSPDRVCYSFPGTSKGKVYPWASPHRRDWGVGSIGDPYPDYEEFQETTWASDHGVEKRPGKYRKFAGKPLNNGRIVGAAPGLDALSLALEYIKLVQQEADAAARRRQVHIVLMLSYGKNFHYTIKRSAKPSQREFDNFRFCSVALDLDLDGSRLSSLPIKCPGGTKLSRSALRWEAITKGPKDSIGGWSTFEGSLAQNFHNIMDESYKYSNRGFTDEQGIVHYEVTDLMFTSIDGNVGHENETSKLSRRLRPALNKERDGFIVDSNKKGYVMRQMNSLQHHENIKFFLASGNNYPTYDNEAQWQFDNILEGSLRQNKNKYFRGDWLGRYPKSGRREESRELVEKLINKTKFYYPSKDLECVLHNVEFSYDLDGAKVVRSAFFHSNLKQGINKNKIVWEDVTKDDTPTELVSSNANKKNVLVTITRCCREPTDTPILSPPKKLETCAKQRVQTDLLKAVSIKTLSYKIVVRAPGELDSENDCEIPGRTHC